MNLSAVTSHLLFRLLGRPIIFAVPFAIFFFIMYGERISDFPWYYLASLIFSTLINSANLANARWVVPRLSPRDRAAEGKPLLLEIASFAAASLAASFVAAITLHLTIVPGMLGTAQDILKLATWSCLFVILVMGLIYAVSFQRQFLDRIRTEAREEQELKIAAQIQQALLPPRSIAGATFTAAGDSIPCRTIGGDFFDTFELSDGRLGFALGDVAGKGPPAAILAAMVQGILASHVRDGAGPAETLDRVNQALLRRAIESRFATLVYGVLSPDGALLASNAGHNPTFLFRADGSLERFDKGGLMVGAFDFAAYEEDRVALRPGDTIVLYSDGVTDATSPSGDQFGEERFLASLATAHRETPDALVTRLTAEISAFAAGQPPADDVTLLVVRYGAGASSPAASRSTS